MPDTIQTTFLIEEGVPLPPPAFSGGTNARLRAILATAMGLRVGQSFFVPEPDKRVRANFASSLTTEMKRKTGKARTITVRSSADGFRVWRIG
jgi:hypothetical protein